MTTSKNRYFKIVEIDTGTFQMLEDERGNYIQTVQIPGLETRCRLAKRGFHFWVFLPDKANRLKCLACGNVINLSRENKPEPPPSKDNDQGFWKP